MRKILVPFALMGLTSLPFAACDVEDGDGDTTDTTNQPDTSGDTADVPEEIHFYTIVVDDTDRFDGRCATSSSGAHGADINAVELSNGSGSLGFFVDGSIVYQPGTDCTIGDNHDNPEEAAGDPGDGSLTDGFVSLGGGLIAGEITAASVELLPGYTVEVFEIDDDFCAGISSCVGSEPYDVWITEENACLTTRTDCETVTITGTDGAEGTSTTTLAGF
jgi:hypothetical protein